MKLTSFALAAALAVPGLVFAANEWKFTSKTPVSKATEEALKAVAGVTGVTAAGTTVTVTGDHVNADALKSAATKAGLTEAASAATTTPAAPATHK